MNFGNIKWFLEKKKDFSVEWAGFLSHCADLVFEVRQAAR
jgi:hypothetical protein